jgi:hypothetical protein
MRWIAWEHTDERRQSIHHLTPAAIIDFIALAHRVLKPNTGAVLLCELFPLLHAEKFAVPYRENELSVFFGNYPGSMHLMES